MQEELSEGDFLRVGFRSLSGLSVAALRLSAGVRLDLSLRSPPVLLRFARDRLAVHCAPIPSSPYYELLLLVKKIFVYVKNCLYLFSNLNYKLNLGFLYFGKYSSMNLPFLNLLIFYNKMKLYIKFGAFLFWEISLD